MFFDYFFLFDLFYFFNCIHQIERINFINANRRLILAHEINLALHI